MKAFRLKCNSVDLDGMLTNSLFRIEYSVRAASAPRDLPLQQESLRKMIGLPIKTILSKDGNISECVSIAVDCTL
jgi:hypothetical protein